MDRSVNSSARRAVAPGSEPTPLVAVICAIAVFGALAALDGEFGVYSMLRFDNMHLPGIDWQVLGAWIQLPLLAAQFVLCGYGAYALNQRGRFARTVILAGTAVAFTDAVVSVVFDWLWRDAAFGGQSFDEIVRTVVPVLAIGCGVPVFVAFLVTRPVLREWLERPSQSGPATD